MSQLYIVPTPVGNLDDMTFRAVKTLQKADLILAEDTRKSSKLLKHFQVTTSPISSFHKFNEHKELEQIVRQIKLGKLVALISDAGTPGISDPGYLLVRKVLTHNIPVYCLPGATALIPALVQSGLPCDRFVFEGFLPPKKGRQTRLELLAKEQRTIVLYESPHRLIKTLTQLISFFGGSRSVSVSREISKLYEETIRGNLDAILSHFETHPPKGEFVLCIDGIKPRKQCVG